MSQPERLRRRRRGSGSSQFSGQRKSFRFASQTRNLCSHDHIGRRYRGRVPEHKGTLVPRRQACVEGASMGTSRYLVLTAMIFAVAMMSIDQTIVSIAAPTIQRDLALTSTGLQWVINGYLLALAAFFAFGGKLSDVVGHRKMVIVGTVAFAAASVLCGATPKGSAAQAWLIAARILQGASGALLFPAALAIVFNAFAPRERGKALALFFGISGALTSIGPIAGSFLLPWTWRAIFLINVPVALVALALTWRARPADTSRPSPIDARGAVLVSAGMTLAV